MIKNKRSCYFILFLFLSTSAIAKNHLVELKTESPEEVRKWLTIQGFEVEGYSKKRKALQVITAFPFVIGELAKKSPDIGSLFTIGDVTETESYFGFANKKGLKWKAEENYLGAEESVAQLRKLEAEFPSVAKIYNLNEFLGLKATEEGRHIYALHVSLHPEKIEDKPKVLFLGQHHARELMTQHAVLDAAEALLRDAKSGMLKAQLSINEMSFWFVPVLNPDGLDYVLSTDRMWRKNRSRNVANLRGVDLNRNYSVKWGVCGNNSSESNSEVFKGLRPDSEPEVQVNEKLNERLHFQYSISYHSLGDEVLNPYLCGEMAESAVYFKVRDELSTLLQYGQRAPSSGGEDHEYHYNKFGTLAFLLEIGDEFQPDFSEYRRAVWPTVKKVLPYVAEQAREHYLKIKVIDDETGASISGAQLAIQEIVFKENEQRTTDDFGSYWWRLPEGLKGLSVTKLNYETQSLALTITGKVDSVVVRLKKKNI